MSEYSLKPKKSLSLTYYSTKLKKTILLSYSTKLKNPLLWSYSTKLKKPIFQIYSTKLKKSLYSWYPTLPFCTNTDLNLTTAIIPEPSIYFIIYHI